MKIECVICRKEISKKDNYLKVELFLKGKLKGTDYAHKHCWVQRNQMNNKIKELVDGGLNLLKSSGLNNKQEEVIIV